MSDLQLYSVYLNIFPMKNVPYLIGKGEQRFNLYVRSNQKLERNKIITTTCFFLWRFSGSTKNYNFPHKCIKYGNLFENVYIFSAKYPWFYLACSLMYVFWFPPPKLEFYFCIFSLKLAKSAKFLLKIIYIFCQSKKRKQKPNF